MICIKVTSTTLVNNFKCLRVQKQEQYFPELFP